MTVRPVRLPRSPKSASFPTLFRSILVAAFAAQGCADLVPAAPDAATPDVAPPDASGPGPGASVDAGACGSTPPFECNSGGVESGICGDSLTWPTCAGGVWSCPSSFIRGYACRCTGSQCPCGVTVCDDAGADGGRSFPCGTRRCDPATQYCRGLSGGGVGASIAYSCETLPAACAGAATCVCVAPPPTDFECHAYADGAVHVARYTP